MTKELIGDGELPEIGQGPVLPYCQEALDFLVAGRASCGRLLATAQTERVAPHREDILRAMLVFGSAALDRSTKSLVEKGLRPLAAFDYDIESHLVKFAANRLAPGGNLDAKVLASVLLSPWTPRHALVEALIQELTGGSLQSCQQLMRVATFLRLEDGFLVRRKAELDSAFQARNSIVHELDLAHDGDALVQVERPEATYVRLTGAILAVGQDLVLSTSARIEAVMEADPYWRSHLREYRERADPEYLPQFGPRRTSNQPS